MIPGLPLIFSQPWLLTALVLLPAIWWLLRFTPPRPTRVAFPPTRILLEIDPREETPSKSPWWLILLRMLIAALVILALSQPVLNPPPMVATGSGPILLLVDNGWGSAPRWESVAGTAQQVIDQAEADGRPIALVSMAGDTTVPAPSGAQAAREKLGGLAPAPHAPERMALADAVDEAVGTHGFGEIVWLSDGLAHADGADFAERLGEVAQDANLDVVAPSLADLPLALGPASNDAGGLRAEALRAGNSGTATGTIRARDLRGRVVGEAPFDFSEGTDRAEAVFDLPVEIRNQIARLEIAEERASGAVQLLDDRWRRRVVGLVSGESRERAQPLLSPLYYINRALAPFADLRQAPDPNAATSIDTLLDDRVSALVLADIGNLAPEAVERLERWIANGGVLVRFAGPRLAAAQEESLVPTELRGGERALGGTLSWSEPQALAAFPSGSPFAGLPVPADVRVERQVLAEPAGDLAEKSWALLEDGTPLVTGARSGQGWIVLFHTTADAAWSNLPLSGAFVEMLRRLVDLSSATGAAGGEAASDAVLRPLRSLDASGQLVAPPGRARPVEAAGIDGMRPNADHPPGLYGETEAFRALNVMGAETEHRALDLSALPVTAYPTEEPRALGPWLLAAALALLVLDGIAVLLLGGRNLLPPRRRMAGAGLAITACILFAFAQPAAAQDDASGDTFALQASLETRLAYVLTGNTEIDETSRAGLAGLSRILTNRTALEPAEPLGVDVAQDELAFFPIIYWPIDHDAELPSQDVLARVDTYMKQGGTILFDTRDEIDTAPGPEGGAGPGMLRLRQMMQGLDLPQLEPVPGDHVLTKSFYLLQDFPGRWEGGSLWVEASLREPGEAARPARNADGVSAIMITSNDFAGAWAADEMGRPLNAVTPGGDWQREMAYRSGVNIVIYALTGNYKADQVHIPALLERLGQ